MAREVQVEGREGASLRRGGVLTDCEQVQIDQLMDGPLGAQSQDHSDGQASCNGAHERRPNRLGRAEPLLDDLGLVAMRRLLVVAPDGVAGPRSTGAT
jgi:hypothetical protein